MLYHFRGWARPLRYFSTFDAATLNLQLLLPHTSRLTPRAAHRFRHPGEDVHTGGAHRGAPLRLSLSHINPVPPRFDNR